MKIISSSPRLYVMQGLSSILFIWLMTVSFFPNLNALTKSLDSFGLTSGAGREVDRLQEAEKSNFPSRIPTPPITLHYEETGSLGFVPWHNAESQPLWVLSLWSRSAFFELILTCPQHECWEGSRENTRTMGGSTKELVCDLGGFPSSILPGHPIENKGNIIWGE